MAGWDVADGKPTYYLNLPGLYNHRGGTARLGYGRLNFRNLPELARCNISPNVHGAFWPLLAEHFTYPVNSSAVQSGGDKDIGTHADLRTP